MSVKRGSDQFIVRMPDGMRESIKRLAEANRRSMNSEFLCLIEAGIEAEQASRATGAQTARQRLEG